MGGVYTVKKIGGFSNADVRSALLALCEWIEFDPIHPGGFECSHGHPIFDCPGEFNDDDVVCAPCKDRADAENVRSILEATRV